MKWLESSGMLAEIVVLASGVLPPQRFFVRDSRVRDWIFSKEKFWASFDGTFVASTLGCYYFITARKQ